MVPWSHTCAVPVPTDCRRSCSCPAGSRIPASASATVRAPATSATATSRWSSPPRTPSAPASIRPYPARPEDLHRRGLLATTLVLAMGEFGRTPRLNPRGGRDHWTGCWTVLFAGGGVRGGRVVGSSDATGAEPKDRPVSPAEVAATVYRGLGVDPSTLLPGPDNRLLPLVEAAPMEELFRG